jgi:hypothetical protein
MAALLDTHALIWWVEGDPRISPRLRAQLGSAEEDVFVSAASAWEIATKARLNKLTSPRVLLADFAEAIETLGFLPLPIEVRPWPGRRPAARSASRSLRPHSRGAGACRGIDLDQRRSGLRRLGCPGALALTMPRMSRPTGAVHH